jgi:hypothetical protein
LAAGLPARRGGWAAALITPITPTNPANAAATNNVLGLFIKRSPERNTKRHKHEIMLPAKPPPDKYCVRAGERKAL